MLHESYADYTGCEHADLTSTSVALIRAGVVCGMLARMPILRHAHFTRLFYPEMHHVDVVALQVFFFSSSQFTHVCSNRYDRSPVLNRTCTLTLTRCCYALQFNPTISWGVDLEMSRRIQELLGHVCAIRAQLSVKKM